MLKPRHIFLGAALLLLMGSLWVYLATWAPSYEKCQADYADKKTTETQYGGDTGISERLGSLVICESAAANENGSAITALATLIMALFTGTLWWATSEQGKLTQKSIDLAEREFKTTQRAFVYLDSLVANFSLLSDNPKHEEIEIRSKLAHDLIVTGLWIQPIWRNSGSTPTKNMRIQVWFGNGGLWSLGQYRNPPTPFFLGPQAASGSSLVWVPSAFVNEDIEWKNNPIGTVPPWMIWGRADYDDIFGGTHFIEWCYSPESTRTIPSERLRISFIQTDQYNRSDYDQRE